VNELDGKLTYVLRSFLAVLAYHKRSNYRKKNIKTKQEEEGRRRGGEERRREKGPVFSEMRFFSDFARPATNIEGDDDATAWVFWSDSSSSFPSSSSAQLILNAGHQITGRMTRR